MKATLMLLVMFTLAVPSPILASDPAPDPATAHYEVKFMTGMIDHHAMAVMMGQMCLEKAVHPDLIAMCQNIIAAQSQEISQMQSWLQGWYGISYSPDVKETGSMKKLMSMSGAMFEIEFMQMMIRHHEAAVKEGQHCLRKAYHPDLLQLCQNIVTTQTQEIQQMQGWLCSWYSICTTAP
jgi:uncharacterized protein (DUF305 family)